MVTILAHVRIRPDRLRQFEAIERDLATATHANEPDCIRYECWRAAEENKYYVLLGFRDSAAFYNHQVSDWHEKHVPGLFECFADFHLEFVDPVAGAGSDMPSTVAAALPSDAPPLALNYEREMPIVEQEWWRSPDGGISPTDCE